jgi:hypothetical protein
MVAVTGSGARGGTGELGMGAQRLGTPVASGSRRSGIGGGVGGRLRDAEWCQHVRAGGGALVGEAATWGGVLGGGWRAACGNLFKHWYYAPQGEERAIKLLVRIF